MRMTDQRPRGRPVVERHAGRPSRGAPRTPPALDPTAPFVSLNVTHHLRPFLELAKEAGADIHRILEKAGLTEQKLLDPGTRVTFETTQRLLQQLIAPTRISEIGLVAADRYGPQDFDLLGYLAAQSTDAWSCLETISRYSRLICDSIRYGLERIADRAIVCIYVAGGRNLLPEIFDCQLASLHRMLRLFTGTELAPLEVHLARARPQHAEPYRRYFGTKIRFGASRNLLVYPEAALRAPLLTRNDRLKTLLAQQADVILAGLPELQTLMERVRGDIKSRLESGDVSSTATARRLGLSERTLRRYLMDAGRSYRILYEAVRREQIRSRSLPRRPGFREATGYLRRTV